MENAVEALKMAGSVLLFVIALSIAMLSFTQAREAIETVIKYSDREYSSIERNERFYYLANSNDTQRYVGIETIIPTIYRAFSESYKVVFKFPDSYYLYKNKIEDREVYKIDSVEESGISDKLDFLNGIVYGKYDPSKGNFGPNDRRQLHSQSLYDYLSDKLRTYKIKETLGTYYMEDRMDAEENRLNIRKDEEGNPSEISDVNKRELRVITYTFESI